MNLLTIREAAFQLGISRRGMQKLCERGRVKHERIGRQIVIRQQDLDKIGERKPGRPRKAAK
jgi:excisionase family DNA binding protein